MYLSFVIAGAVAFPAINHNHTVSGIHCHGNRENSLDSLLKRGLARFSLRNSIFQWHTLEVHSVIGKPVVQRRQRLRIRNSLAVEVVPVLPAPSGKEVKV